MEEEEGDVRQPVKRLGASAGASEDMAVAGAAGSPGIWTAQIRNEGDRQRGRGASEADKAMPAPRERKRRVPSASARAMATRSGFASCRPLTGD